MNVESRGKIELIIAMIISGTVGMFVLESGQSSYNAVFYRCLFGGVCLVAYCVFKGYLNLAKLSQKQWMLIFSSGIAVVLNWVLLFESYRHASISISTVAYHTQPLFLVVFAAIFFGEKLKSYNLLYILLAFLGVILIVDPAGDSTGNASQIYGLIFALAAAVLYAIATLLIKLLEGVRPQLIATLQILLGLILLLPFINLNLTPTSVNSWAWLLGLGVLHTSIMYILLYSSFHKVPTSSIAVLSYIYPVVAIVVDYIVYDQNLSAIQFTGIAMIVFAGFANNRNINVFNLVFLKKSSQRAVSE